MFIYKRAFSIPLHVCYHVSPSITHGLLKLISMSSLNTRKSVRAKLNSDGTTTISLGGLGADATRSGASIHGGSNGSHPHTISAFQFAAPPSQGTVIFVDSVHKLEVWGVGVDFAVACGFANMYESDCTKSISGKVHSMFVMLRSVIIYVRSKSRQDASGHKWPVSASEHLQSLAIYGTCHRHNAPRECSIPNHPSKLYLNSFARLASSAAVVITVV